MTKYDYEYPVNLLLKITNQENPKFYFHYNLNSALKRLCPEDREVIKLRFEDKMSLSEISNRIGESKQRVTAMINHGIRKMRHPFNFNYMKQFVIKIESTFSNTEYFSASERFIKSDFIRNEETEKQFLYHIYNLWYKSLEYQLDDDEKALAEKIEIKRGDRFATIDNFKKYCSKCVSKYSDEVNFFHIFDDYHIYFTKYDSYNDSVWYVHIHITEPEFEELKL